METYRRTKPKRQNRKTRDTCRQITYRYSDRYNNGGQQTDRQNRSDAGTDTKPARQTESHRYKGTGTQTHRDIQRRI